VPFYPFTPVSTAPSGPAGGDLGGTYPDPSVLGIDGVEITGSAPTAGQILEAQSGSTMEWVTGGGGPPSGAAGGDLSGTYPDPVVSQIDGQALPVPVSLGGTGATTAIGALAALGGAPLASPALTGSPTAPTKPALTDNTDIATTGYTDAAVAVETSRAEAAEATFIPQKVIVQTLAVAAASITFNAIPAGYNQLRLVVIGASAAAAETDRWLVAVNGDSGAHYDTDISYVNDTTLVGLVKNAQTGWLGAAAAPVGDMPAASATPGVAGILEIVIPAYAGTALQKVGLWRSGYCDAATSASDQLYSGAIMAWRSAAAISSITIVTVTGSNLVAGTTAVLYLS
jgi:hypothetical protein